MQLLVALRVDQSPEIESGELETLHLLTAVVATVFRDLSTQGARGRLAHGTAPYFISRPLRRPPVGLPRWLPRGVCHARHTLLDQTPASSWVSSLRAVARNWTPMPFPHLRRLTMAKNPGAGLAAHDARGTAAYDTRPGAIDRWHRSPTLERRPEAAAKTCWFQLDARQISAEVCLDAPCPRF